MSSTSLLPRKRMPPSTSSSSKRHPSQLIFILSHCQASTKCSWRKLDEIKKVAVTLCGKCNVGMMYPGDKGMILDMFNMWLMHQGITNLLSIPTLEQYGHKCFYNTQTSWVLHCPDALVLKLKRDIRVC